MEIQSLGCIEINASKVWGDIAGIGNDNPTFKSIMGLGGSIKVGYGELTSFWLDIWCGDKALDE